MRYPVSVCGRLKNKAKEQSRDSTKVTAMKSKININKIIIFLIALFFVITMLLIGWIVLDYNDVFDTKPRVTVKPNNTYTETLYVATDHDYRPFSYIDDGEYAGLDVELIAEVANRLEMNLELTLLDWNDAQAGLLDGTYDIILNMESNAILKDDRLIGTIPTDEKQYVVYGKNKISYVGELYGMRVAAYNKFDELGMNVITGYSYQEMFEMLLNDELDYVICPIQIGDAFLEKLNAKKTIVSSYQVSYMYGCMALKAEDVELCAKLNDVIKQLQVEGVIEKLDNKWITSRYGDTSFKGILQNNPSMIVLLVIGIQLIIFGSIFLVIISYNSKKQEAYAAELQKNIAIINKQNEELKIAEEKAHAASIAKSNFLFNMSHDIRTPMNAIIGFTNLAKLHVGDEKINDYLSKIATSSNLLLGLINDILEMSRIESGKTQLNLAPENILEMMEEIDSVIRGQANEKNQELLFQCNAEHKYVLCDKLKFNQIMINIISNAIKYTDNDGHIFVSLEETESSDEDKAKYTIRVKDDGIGMSEEFQGKIFEPFEREKTTTVSKLTGTGLGMAITKNLIELMDGTISLESKLGEGSEFTVVLEFARTEEPLRTTEQNNAAETVKKEDVKYHILVVDDNEINRMIATELLNNAGYITDEATDGQEAVEMIKNAAVGDYDLILMDIQMPVMNGYEATKNIRASGAPLASIPIIALTANAFEEDRKDAENAGMNGHVAKPIDIDILDKTINDLLQKK